MNIVIDLTPFIQLIELPPHLAIIQFLLYVGWIPLLIVFLWGIWQVWILSRREKFLAKQQYVLLAIDVPKDNTQGPEAVERLFAHLAGAKFRGNWIERNIHGYCQLSFSFELVSINGQIQFLIRTPVALRDLVESAVYATYPDAAITEVEDYTFTIPDKFPNEEYDLWGADLVLYNKDPFPIRTYPAFEHKLTQEFKDPLTDLLEIFGKFQKGEQGWLQLIITPIDQKWKSAGERLVKKLMGRKVEYKKAGLEHLIELPLGVLRDLGEIIWMGIIWIWMPSSTVKKEEGKEYLLLSPGEKRIIEAIENKISKIGFAVKFRMIYLAEKEIFNKAKGVAGVLGALSQFNTLDMNGFKPDSRTITSAAYLLVKERLGKKQTRILKNYKERRGQAGAKQNILNIEELATLYHFPVQEVKAPMIKKAGSKRGEPPFGLPTV